MFETKIILYQISHKKGLLRFFCKSQYNCCKAAYEGCASQPILRIQGWTRRFGGLSISSFSRAPHILFCAIFTIKYSIKKFLAIPPPPKKKKILNQSLDYNTVLRLQIFLEILDNYWFFIVIN